MCSRNGIGKNVLNLTESVLSASQDKEMEYLKRIFCVLEMFACVRELPAGAKPVTLFPMIGAGAVNKNQILKILAQVRH